MPNLEIKLPRYADIIYPILSFAGGMNTHASELLLGRDVRFGLRHDQARLIINMVRTQSGALTTRPGRVKLNATPVVPAAGDAEIRSIFELRPTGGNSSILINAGNTIYKWDTGSSSFVSQGTVVTANLRRHWCQFQDLAVGFDGSNAPVRYNGTTLANLAGSPPAGATVCAAHRNRVWALQGRTLHYSALGNAEDWTTANNAGSVPVPTTRGLGGTGLLSIWERLLIFTDSQIFQLFGSGPGTFEVSPINLQYGHRGSPYGVVAAGNDIFFANDIGAHAVSVAESLSVVGDVEYSAASGVIEPTWQDVDATNLGNIVAVHDSTRNLVIFLANRLGANNTEAFVADYYHLDEQGNPTWSLYSNMPFSSAAEVSSLNTFREVLFGAYNGYVYRQTAAETDDGTSIPIQLQFITDLGVPEFHKLWRHMLALVHGASGIITGTFASDFGEHSIAFTIDPVVGGGDLIGSTFVIGTSTLGTASFKQVRVPIPDHGRIATITLNSSSSRRITIGGFIFYAGRRRVLQ